MAKTKVPAEIPLLYVRQDLGNGRPMVLLHGMFGDGTQWRIVASLLADYYRVIVVDLLGHGLSPRPKNAKYTGQEHSLSLRRTLEQLGATDDATVVGYSMGGTVALQYAADYHDVSQLFLISTPFYLNPKDMVANGYANSVLYTKLSLGFFRQVEKRLHPGKLLYKIVNKGDMMQWLHVLIDAYDNKLDSDIMRMNLHQLITEFPFASNLKRVTSPITFYSGKRDVFVVQAQLRALKKIQPLMEIETLGLVKNDHAVVQYLPHQIVGVLKRYHEQELHTAADIGKGEVLVLLHGIESSGAYWSNVLPNLSKNYRVITIDLLGFGKSVKPMNVAYSLEDQVKWVHRTLKAKSVNKFHLVGHSLGALVSLAYASTHTDQVLTLTMVSPVFFDDLHPTKRLVVRKLKFIDYFSDTSYLASTISKAVGPKRLKPYVPTLRSIDNAIKKQHGLELASNVRKIPTTIMYGKNDILVDPDQLGNLSKKLQNVKIVTLENMSHNFPLTNPQIFLENLSLGYSELPKPKRSTLKPTKILKQITKLAVPILLLKSALYLVAGLLLFSQYKEETLVIAVSATVIFQGIQFIKGSFSLKNEGLSYLGYLLIGVFGIILGYVLTNHFNFSLKIALIIVCGFILVNGLARIIAGLFWTTDHTLRRRQLASGLILLIASGAAFLGSLASVYAIIYALAAFLIIRSLTLGFYIIISLFTAFVRSF